ncbi:tripartite tricarboxylate transporter substrate binding protein [Bradyrhizobium cosmicum]|uniref:Bug family tripartite tricarboxylate transporter substrate binding protein n=1 Tax=Bradyrhizobium cosmicum TaxID=1404864 RepID=UPI0028EBF7F2|nr:tripartite tricarboxylate transporter substrate binding protein [Bradyrhizobium cosmicum]
MRTSVVVTRRDLLMASAAGAAAALLPQSKAQTLAKTVQVVTGFAPGLTDGVARLISGQFKDYAASVVVETRPGASGRIAVEAVKAADADGSVILFAPLGFVILFPLIYKTLRYTPGDFIPVSAVASFPALLTVGPKVPNHARTLADFVEWCRTNPKAATYGTPGIGTTLHLIGAMLGRAANIEFLHVPYQGSSAIQDLLKGEIASAIMPIGSSLGLVRSGELRALATTGPRRSLFLPDVPTVAECGYPSLEDLTRYGFFVPARTPANVVERLNDAIQQTLHNDEVRLGMEKLAVEIDAVSMGDFSRLIGSESRRWRTIVEATGFTPID